MNGEQHVDIDAPTAVPVSAHPRDIELYRLADAGDGRVASRVVDHVQGCEVCAQAVRYARAARTALLEAIPNDSPPEDILRGVLSRIADADASPSPAPHDDDPLTQGPDLRSTPTRNSGR
jgi:hypothetical protein